MSESTKQQLSTIRMRNRAGSSTFVTLSGLHQTDVALRALYVLDRRAASDEAARFETQVQSYGPDKKIIRNLSKHLKTAKKQIEALQRSENTPTLAHLMIQYSKFSENGFEKAVLNAEARRVELLRALRTVVSVSMTFDRIEKSLKPSDKDVVQDPNIYLCLDALCAVLRDLDVVVTRNPDSSPFYFILTALRAVRADVRESQIESYLQLTRQGVGRSSFGGTWAEYEQLPPERL